MLCPLEFLPEALDTLGEVEGRPGTRDLQSRTPFGGGLVMPLLRDTLSACRRCDLRQGDCHKLLRMLCFHFFYRPHGRPVKLLKFHVQRAGDEPKYKKCSSPIRCTRFQYTSIPGFRITSGMTYWFQRTFLYQVAIAFAGQSSPDWRRGNIEICVCTVAYDRALFPLVCIRMALLCATAGFGENMPSGVRLVPHITNSSLIGRATKVSEKMKRPTYICAPCSQKPSSPSLSRQKSGRRLSSYKSV